MKGSTALKIALNAIVLSCLPVAANAATVQLQVTITNNASAGGFALTPLWAGFHGGGFDSHDVGSPSSSALERLAEDGIPHRFLHCFLQQIVLVSRLQLEQGQ